jgi:hypothetical protein
MQKMDPRFASCVNYQLGWGPAALSNLCLAALEAAAWNYDHFVRPPIIMRLEVNDRLRLGVDQLYDPVMSSTLDMEA